MHYQINVDFIKNPQQLTMVANKVIDFKNETDRLIYEYIKANKFITTNQVLNITKIKTLSGASVALNRLIDMELLVKIRDGRYFYYKLK